VRLISATNADLPAAIAAGSFREDLFFRLNVIELKLPALAQRTDDIPLLSRQFLARFADDKAPPELAADALDALLAYPWPGNVRELQNRLQRASLVCRDGVIRAADLALPSVARPSNVALEADTGRKSSLGLSASEEEERGRIEDALVRAGSVVSKAAAELGMSRQALYRRMERLGLSLERRVRD
jgi:DNA-binding NtrC family response regulator